MMWALRIANPHTIHQSAPRGGACPRGAPTPDVRMVLMLAGFAEAAHSRRACAGKSPVAACARTQPEPNDA